MVKNQLIYQPLKVCASQKNNKRGLIIIDQPSLFLLKLIHLTLFAIFSIIKSIFKIFKIYSPKFLFHKKFKRTRKEDSVNLGKIGMIFDGGGNTCAYGTGFALAVENKGLRADYVLGVSGGALNGASYVERNGRTDKMILGWKDIETKGQSFLFDFGISSVIMRLRRTAILSNVGLRYLCQNLDMQAIIKSDIQFDVVVFDEKANRQKIFSNCQKEVQENPEILRKAIRASASIPGIFKSVNINGRDYCDGASFLIKPAIRAGCETIFLFLNEPLELESVETVEWGWFNRLLLGKHQIGRLLREARVSQYTSFLEELVVFQMPRGVPGLTSTSFEQTKNESDQGLISQAIDLACERGLEILDDLTLK